MERHEQREMITASIKKGGEKEIRQAQSRSRKGKKTHGISIYRMEVKE